MKARVNPPLLNQKQFDLIAELLRSIEPPRTAVFMVLVKGETTRAAADKTGLSMASVFNAIKRYRLAHEKILAAYGKAGLVGRRS